MLYKYWGSLKSGSQKKKGKQGAKKTAERDAAPGKGVTCSREKL